jgi:hypothetical protein
MTPTFRTAEQMCVECVLRFACNASLHIKLCFVSLSRFGFQKNPRAGKLNRESQIVSCEA